MKQQFDVSVQNIEFADGSTISYIRNSIMSLEIRIRLVIDNSVPKLGCHACRNFVLENWMRV